MTAMLGWSILAPRQGFKCFLLLFLLKSLYWTLNVKNHVPRGPSFPWVRCWKWSDTIKASNSLAFIVPENKQGRQPVYRSAGLSPDGPPSECPNSLTHVWLVKATRITWALSWTLRARGLTRGHGAPLFSLQPKLHFSGTSDRTFQKCLPGLQD